MFVHVTMGSTDNASFPPPLAATSSNSSRQATRRTPQQQQHDNNSTNPTKHSGLKSLVAGGFGGVCEALVGHPLDLVKVRLQTSTHKAASTGILPMMTSIVRQQGPLGLYRGVSAPLYTIAPAVAVDFWAYNMAKELVVGQQEQQQQQELSMNQVLCAAVLSAVPSLVITTPSDRIKCLLQTDASFRGFHDCLYQVVSKGGIQSLYRGTVANICRDVPGHVAWFGTYEYIKRQLQQYSTWNTTNHQQQQDSVDSQVRTVSHPEHNHPQTSVWIVTVAGGTAGVLYTVTALPMDVIKSRIQAGPILDRTTILQTYRDLVREEGYGAFVRGMNPSLIRAFPANAACFLGMEWAHQLLHKLF